MLDKIMETLGNFKFILICFSDCSPLVNSGCMQLLYILWGNWVLEMVIKISWKIRGVFLWSFLRVTLRRSRSDSFHFLPVLRRFLLLSLMLSLLSRQYSLLQPIIQRVFVTLAPAIRAPTFWPLLKSDRSIILIKFDLFLLRNTTA